MDEMWLEWNLVIPHMNLGRYCLLLKWYPTNMAGYLMPEPGLITESVLNNWPTLVYTCLVPTKILSLDTLWGPDWVWKFFKSPQYEHQFGMKREPWFQDQGGMFKTLCQTNTRNKFNAKTLEGQILSKNLFEH
jgi:hypothetical protein